MAAPILRIDVAENSRDFQLVALEPGLPMLDRGGVNSSTLFKWLGPLAAEPDFDGDSVRYYVRDVMGGRPEDVECYPATEDDLKGPLRKGLEELQEKIGAVKPENSTEEAIHGIISSRFETLLADEGEQEREVSFFKYRIGTEPWRLIWCWGYQRRDQQPAPAMICTDPACKLLFLRLPGHPAKCPGCSEFSAILVRKRKKWPLAVAALALLLLLGVGLWMLDRPKLIVTPGKIAGRAGTTQHFTVERSRLISSFFFGNDDVTQEVVAFSYAPAVVEVEGQGATARLKSTGQAVVRFLHNGLEQDVLVEVSPPTNPLELYLDPEGLIALAVDATHEPKIMGEWEDGPPAELSDSIVWEYKPDGIVRVSGGKLQGIAEGEVTLVAKYRASPENDYVTLDVAVKVTPMKFQAIAARLDPGELVVGQSGRISVLGTTEDGQELSLSDSSAIEYAILPEGVAHRDENGYLVADQETAEGELTVKYGDLSASVSFSVGAGSLFTTLVVVPGEVELYVGQMSGLDVRGPGTEEATIVSADPDIVEVFGESQTLVGRGSGTTTLTVTKGGETVEVQATVSGDVLELVTSLAIVPSQITVKAGGYKSFSVVGYVGEGRSVDIVADRLDWQQLPSPLLAEVDKALMTVNGHMVTGDVVQKLAVGVTGRDDLAAAQADVFVIASGRQSGIGILLAGDPFRDAPPIPVGPQTITYGGTDIVVKPAIDGGWEIVSFSDDQRPFGFEEGDVIPHVRYFYPGYKGHIVVSRPGVGNTFYEVDLGTLDAAGNSFQSVVVDGPIHEGAAAGHFKVAVDVVADRQDSDLQYRAYAKGTEPPAEWVTATPTADGQAMTVALLSPDIKQEPGRGHQYALVIEGKTGSSTQQHLYIFSLSIKKTGTGIEPFDETSPPPGGIPAVDETAPDAPNFDDVEDAPDAPKFDP